MNFIKTITTHEVTVEDRKYQFVIPANAPLGEAYDVAFKFLNLIYEQSKIATESMKPIEPSKTVVQEEKKETKKRE